MKKIIIFLFALALLSCQPAEVAQSAVAFDREGRNIILMHPTVFNIERFLFLTSSGLFPLPEDYSVVGVYHKSAAYNYELSHDYIRDQKLSNIALLGLEPALEPNEVFAENELTADFRKIFEKSQGIIFFGGPDIPPALFQQETSLLTVITDPHRHYLELSFLFHLLGGYQDESHIPLLEQNPDFSILGICLGMQTMNVATGGTMHQDIPTDIYDVHTVEGVLAQPGDEQHRNYYIHFSTKPEVFPYSFHRIQTAQGSIMEQIAGDADIHPFVASSHHQALQKVGKGWQITALSMDGKIIEAIEHELYPNVFGIQFHPEIIPLYNGEILHMMPGQSEGKSFLEAYPGEQGETFHRRFWAYIAKVYDGN